MLPLALIQEDTLLMLIRVNPSGLVLCDPIAVNIGLYICKGAGGPVDKAA